jgi:hypothetical protein
VPVEAPGARGRARPQARRAPGPGRDAVRDWLLGEAKPEPGLLALERSCRDDGWGLPAYLIGRRLYGHGAFDDAAAWFERAEGAGLPDPLLAAENLRLAGRAAYRAGRWEDARRSFGRLEAAAPTRGYAEGARSWRRRLEWLTRSAR